MFPFIKNIGTVINTIQDSIETKPLYHTHLFTKYRKINNKIFVIGFNKTGTTSFNDLFINNRIKSNHSSRDVLDIIDRYDAFTDGSHLNFKSYYEARPNSLFILNVRPINKWLISRYKHGKLHNWKERWCWPPSEEKTLEFIKIREQHFYNVLKFFTPSHI